MGVEEDLEVSWVQSEKKNWTAFHSMEGERNHKFKVHRLGGRRSAHAVLGTDAETRVFSLRPLT